MSDKPAIKIVTGPTFEPVALIEAKAQCRVDTNDEDLFIAGLITAARVWCERNDWRVYQTQTLEVWFDDGFPCGKISLPRPPLQSVTSIKYYDVSDVEATVPTTDYQVDTVSEPGRVGLRYGKMWPVTRLRDMNAVVVRYVAGWTTPEAVPANIKHAIKLVIGHWYENREDSVTGTVSRQIELGAKALLSLDQVKRF